MAAPAAEPQARRRKARAVTRPDDAATQARDAYTSAKYKYMVYIESHPHNSPEAVRLLDLAGAAYFKWALEMCKIQGVAVDPKEYWRFPTTPTETETAR